MVILKYENLQKAWEGMNEFLFIKEGPITKKDYGGAFGSQMVCLDSVIQVENASIDPEFDFGEKLGYSIAKWTALVNNYIEYNYIDMLRAEVTKREKQGARMYNYTLHFSNKYGSGKDCLISLTVARRPNRDKPFASFVIRTSEITKRLLFDFLLVQRIIEYIYGHNKVNVHLYAQHWYITAESFIMYNNIKPIKKLYKKHLKGKKLYRFQEKIMEKFDEFMNHPDPHNVMFRVNRRSMLQIQTGKDGKPLSGVKSMKAKNLVLREFENYPEGVVTRKQILKHKKNNGK